MNDPSPLPPSKQQEPERPYQLYSYSPIQSEDDEISLLDLWRIMVRYKTLIIAITLATTVVAVAIAFLMTPIYRAEVLLAPVSDDERGSINSITSQFGGLASLVGVDLGASNSNTNQVLATLSSKRFLDKFIADNHLMQVLYADKWDANAKRWKIKDPSAAPTKLDAYDMFHKNILDVTSDNKTGLVTIAVAWKDPQIAAQWANDLVARLNRYEQQQSINEAEKSIAYLREQLLKTSVMEVQQSIYRLLEVQTKKIMLARVRDEYSFKVIDPAVPPEKQAKPNRILICSAGIMLGVTLSILIIIFRKSTGRATALENGKS